jgi:hypothetical protein
MKSEEQYSTCGTCTKTPFYLVKTRDWMEYVYVTNSKPMIEHCMKEWKKIKDMCPSGWNVIHKDPPTYRLESATYKRHYFTIICTKMVTCESPV